MYRCSQLDRCLLQASARPDSGDWRSSAHLRMSRINASSDELSSQAVTGTPCTLAMPSTSDAGKDSIRPPTFSPTFRRSDGHTPCSPASTFGPRTPALRVSFRPQPEPTPCRGRGDDGIEASRSACRRRRARVDPGTDQPAQRRVARGAGEIRSAIGLLEMVRDDPRNRGIHQPAAPRLDVG